jgi:hypothetical protein
MFLFDLGLRKISLVDIFEHHLADGKLNFLVEVLPS